MPNEGGREVLRDTGALTLGDEPLAGGVEHRTTQVRMQCPEVGIALDHPIDGQ